MQYRDHEYSVSESVAPQGWKWIVSLGEKVVRTGRAPTRMEAMNMARMAIDKTCDDQAGAFGRRRPVEAEDHGRGSHRS
jgi:hypothetical protein